MASAPDRLSLAAGFPAADADDWRALVAGVLAKSGREFDDPVAALTRSSYDGIDIAPLYDGPVERSAPVTQRAAWDVRAYCADPDAPSTNRAVLTDLAKGATSLWLGMGADGLAVADLGRALDGVYLDLAPIALDAGNATRDAARGYLDLARQQGVTDLAGDLGADPVGARARSGGEYDATLLADLVRAAQAHPRVRIATVDGTVYADAGSSDADELAIATAVGVAYLRALTDAGLTAAAAFDRIAFRFAVTVDQFGSIAKLRAARRLWARVGELSGTTATQHQHAVTSRAMFTRRDPWVNLLRTTIGCFAAAVGGADAITVLPFDTALGVPDDFARRLARNTSAILHDESSLSRVSDAAGGSGYVEARTAALAETAWDAFTALERAGGVLAALDDGRLTATIAETRNRRSADIAHRRRPITGVTEFALPDEAPLPRRSAPTGGVGGALPPMRYAAEFEQLRDDVEARTPRPIVFLAALGPYSEHSVRVGFATNLFNTGGFRVVVGAPDDFADTGARVACLCSSDAGYEVEAAAAVQLLRDGGANYIWLAGRVDADGVDGHLFAGCDVLDVLRTSAAVSS